MTRLVIILSVLWILATLVLISSPKNTAVRWCSLLGYVTGCGDVGNLMYLYVNPQLSPNIRNHVLASILNFMPSLLLLISYHLAPLALLMFSMHYSGVLEKRLKVFKNKLVVILLTPFVFLSVLYPSGFPYGQNKLIALTLLVAPYGVAAIYFLVNAYIKEDTPLLKLERLVTCMVLIPFIFLGFVTSYVCPAFLKLKDTWGIETWGVIVMFVMFIFFSLKYGVLGFRLKLERINF